MNRSDYEEHNAAILAHERGHIRLRHSWDLLLVDLLTALQWFNPAMWMLRQDLRASISISVNLESLRHWRVLHCQRHQSQYPQKQNHYDVT